MSEHVTPGQTPWMLRFVGGSRFTQPDPIEGGCANLYTYAFGDPLNHPDLTGKGCVPPGTKDPSRSAPPGIGHDLWNTASGGAGVGLFLYDLVGCIVGTPEGDTEQCQALGDVTFSSLPDDTVNFIHGIGGLLSSAKQGIENIFNPQEPCWEEAPGPMPGDPGYQPPSYA